MTSRTVAGLWGRMLPSWEFHLYLCGGEVWNQQCWADNFCTRVNKVACHWNPPAVGWQSPGRVDEENGNRSTELGDTLDAAEQFVGDESRRH